MMRIQGIYPPLLTPLTERLEVDKEAMAALMDHVIRGGVHGLFVLGSCGEGSCFAPCGRAEIARAAVEINAGRLPLLAGVLQPSTGLAVECIRQLRDEGIEHFVVTPPYYLGHTQADIIRHFEAVSKVTPGQLILYNIPQFTRSDMDTRTILQLSRLPNVTCIKDSNPDYIAAQDVIQHREQLGIGSMVGNEDTCGAGMLMGGDGIVPCLANIWPKLFVEMYEAGVRRDASAVAGLQSNVSALRRIMKPYANWVGVVKHMAAKKGLCGHAQPEPFMPLDKAAHDRIDAELEGLKMKIGEGSSSWDL